MPRSTWIVRAKAPLAESEWIEWFVANDESWRQRVRVATQRRRAKSTRLSVAADLQPPVERLRPAACSAPPRDAPRWLRLLDRRDGWSVLPLHGGRVRVLLLYCHRGGVDVR